MGIVDNLVDEVKNAKEKIVAVMKPATPGISAGTPDDILTDDDEVERLSRYIDEKNKHKIFNVKTALKYGVDKIGSVGDYRQCLPQLLSGASMKSKIYAAKIYVDKWARENLKDKIISKSGKELVGKLISKNIYLKQVSFMRAGKQISYIQARNRLTGMVVSYKTAGKLLARGA